MKYTTIAALLPLASAAASSNKRQSDDAKFTVTDFEATCDTDPELKGYCNYEFDISLTTNPDFVVGCSILEESDDGELPAVQGEQCGTYKISIAKTNDGGLTLTADLRSERLTGEYNISSSDLEIEEEDGRKVQEYTGKDDFTIDTRTGSSDDGGASSSSSVSEPSSTASQTSGTTTTTTTEPSGTNTADSDAENSDEGGDDENVATTHGTFAGILMAVGLTALMF